MDVASNIPEKDSAMFRFIFKVITTITLTRVILWSFAIILAITGYTVYEHREELFSSMYNSDENEFNVSVNLVGVTFRVSARTRDKVREFVASNPEYVGLGISAADLRLNQRIPIYFYSEEAEGPAAPLFKDYDRLPLFSNDEEDNRQMIKMINGEFHCASYPVSQLAKANPGVNKFVTTICRASLPPYYGHFTGFMTLYLKREPTVEQQLQLKSKLETLATEVYFKDVLPSSKKYD